MQIDELIHMNKVVSQSHLILLFSFIKISIQHLENSVFCINFSIVVLLVNLNFLFQLLGLCQSEKLSPMSKNFHSIEVCHLLLLHHCVFQLVLSCLHDLSKLLSTIIIILLLGISLLYLEWFSSICSLSKTFN